MSWVGLNLFYPIITADVNYSATLKPGPFILGALWWVELTSVGRANNSTNRTSNMPE